MCARPCKWCTLDGYRFRRNAGACFGDILRGIRVVDNNDLAIPVDNAIVAGEFKRADRRFVLALDLALRGRDWDTDEEKRLAVEVSVGLGQSDVERAKSRAVLLQKLFGMPAIPVVAGYSIATEFRRLADGQGVQVVIADEPGWAAWSNYPSFRYSYSSFRRKPESRILAICYALAARTHRFRRKPE